MWAMTHRFTGNRMRYIHITNHRGQKNIPLHVWLVDGNTVLNDGSSETTLKLRHQQWFRRPGHHLEREEQQGSVEIRDLL